MHTAALICVIAAAAFLATAPVRAADGDAGNPLPSPHARLKGVDPTDVRWTEGFWADRFALCRDAILPELQRALHDPDNGAILGNFRIAAGLEEGEHRGRDWSDGDCYKWLEVLAHVYGVTGDEELRRLVDEWIAVIGKAQAADGYLSTNIQLTDKQRYANTHHHELYNMGHLLTAACVHHRVTGDMSFLDVARKAGDHLYATFQPRPAELAHFGWNPSNIMGLVDLYRATRDRRYLELAGIFVDMRGSAPGGTDLNQDRVPLRDEQEAVGHCVCACYLYCGAADVYAETGEEALLAGLERIWGNVTAGRMYITGAVGSFWQGKSSRGDPVHEAFGSDYELPSRTAYNETCANIANAMWNRRMLALTGEARYADVMELVLYNSMLSSVSLDGKGFFYCNPLARDGNGEGLSKHHTPVRWSTWNCYCCPPNAARTIAKLHGWVYSISDEGVWVNLYGGSVLDTELADGSRVTLRQETDYPWDERVKITVSPRGRREFGVMLRIPGWADGARVRVNGKPFRGPVAPGRYAAVRRRWSPGDVVELRLPMPARLMQAHPAAVDLRNRVAVMRGPVVYCLESPDLLEAVRLEDVVIPAGIQLTPRFDGDLLGGVTVLDGQAVRRGVGEETGRAPDEGDWQDVLYRRAEGRQGDQETGASVAVTLIPYYAWANRGASHMAVWLPSAPG